MTRAKSNRLVLTKRDYEIFKFFFQCKIGTAKDIQSVFYEGRSLGTTRNRLSKLYKWKYINRNVIEARPGRFVYSYSLSKVGFKEMRLASPHKIIRQELRSDSPIHDLNIVRIRLKLGGSPNIKCWYSENELQSYQDFQENSEFEPFFNSNTDAVIDVFNKSKTKSRFFGLEYEESPKCPSRIKDKLESYLSQDDIFRVIYISKNQNIQKKWMSCLCKIDSHAGKDKFYFATINEILSASSKFIFENINGNKMEFNI